MNKETAERYAARENSKRAVNPTNGLFDDEYVVVRDKLQNAYGVVYIDVCNVSHRVG